MKITHGKKISTGSITLNNQTNFSSVLVSIFPACVTYKCNKHIISPTGYVW